MLIKLMSMCFFPNLLTIVIDLIYGYYV